MADSEKKQVQQVNTDNSQNKVTQQPGARRFIVLSRLVTDFTTVYRKLGSIPMCSVQKMDSKVVLLNVSNRDINKRPTVFTLIEFGKNEVIVNYAYSAGMSPKKRFFEAMSFFLSIMTTLKEDYATEIADLYQIVARITDELEDYGSIQYEVLYSMYDNLNNEFIRMQAELKQLKESNEQLSIENYKQKTKINELRLLLEKYQSLSDDVLKAKVQQWIVEHNGEIDVVEFSKVFNVYEGRVEQMLNQLISEGFLEVK